MIVPITFQVINEGPDHLNAPASAESAKLAFEAVIRKINEIIASVNDIAMRLERMEALMPHAPGIED